MSQSMFCEQCGAALVLGVRFCEACGQPVVESGSGRPTCHAFSSTSPGPVGRRLVRGAPK